MTKLFLSLVFVSTVLLPGCEPEPDAEELLDQLVVETNVDPSAAFSSYTTYSISEDTIGLVSNINGDDTLIVGTNYARPVVNAIVDNMNARGYVRVDRTGDPDLAVNAFIVKNLDIQQQINYPGYYGYPGYFYPGYYGYGSFYYPYVNTFVYNTEVLVVEIIDLMNPVNNQVRVIWNAHLGDVYSALNPREQSVAAVNQAFIQSPYIQK